MSLFGALWHPASVAAEPVVAVDYLLIDDGSDTLRDDATAELLSVD